MKKALILILALALCLSVFAGCSGAPDAPATNEPASSGDDSSGEITGEYFDAGEVKALVPKDWKAFPMADVFAEEEGATEPDVIQIGKGAKEELDLYSVPYLYIVYSNPDVTLVAPDSTWYDDPVDLEPMTIGNFTWTAFSCTSFGVPMTILFAEGSNNQQYQVTVYTDQSEGQISLEDADVQAIIASIQPSNGSDGNSGAAAADPSGDPAGSEEPVSESQSAYADYWAGDWYGWWVADSAEGVYEELAELGICFDVCANIEVYDDDTGYVKIWDTETSDSEGRYLATCDVIFGEGVTDAGCMMSESGIFFDTDTWIAHLPSTPGAITHADWIVDAGASSVSHFDHMIEIEARYVDPEDEDNRIDYLIYLRPWGMDWEDVKYGDTEDCVFSNMMPIYYEDWYLPLLAMGVTEPPSSYLSGYSIIEGNGPVSDLSNVPVDTPEDPEVFDPNEADPDAGSDGIVDFATLKATFDWLQEITYTAGPDGNYIRPPQEDVEAQLGKAGMVYWAEDWTDTTHYYKWQTEDGSDFLTITFEFKNDNWQWKSTSYSTGLKD